MNFSTVLHNILIFFLILLIISVTIAMWPYTMEAMFIMYLDGMMPICTGTL